MRNRAKCKLCNEIIESFHRYDYVTCKCGEIAVDGGLDMFRAAAINFNNFMRIDDDGKEIEVTVKEKEELTEPVQKPTKKELHDTLKELIKSYDRLPQHAMLEPVSHSDFCSALTVISALLSSD